MCESRVPNPPSQAHLHRHAGESTSKRENENTISPPSLSFVLCGPPCPPQLTLKSVVCVCVCHVYFVCASPFLSFRGFPIPNKKGCLCSLASVCLLLVHPKGIRHLQSPFTRRAERERERRERDGGPAYRTQRNATHARNPPDQTKQNPPGEKKERFFFTRPWTRPQSSRRRPARGCRRHRRPPCPPRPSACSGSSRPACAARPGSRGPAG